jgi:hypothetical protein
VGSLLSGLGLVGTAATVPILARRTRAVQQAGVTTAYQGIFGMASTFNAPLIEHPEILDALHDPALLAEQWNFEERTQRRPQVAMLTVKQLGYFELVLVRMGSLPRSLQEEWRDYIRGLPERAPYMWRALLETDWYTAELRALAGQTQVSARRQATKSIWACVLP